MKKKNFVFFDSSKLDNPFEVKGGAAGTRLGCFAVCTKRSDNSDTGSMDIDDDGPDPQN